MSTPEVNPWTDERVDELKRLMRLGLSYSRIAALLGCGLTRSAISGKVSRLGISQDEMLAAPEDPVTRPRAPAPAAADAPEGDWSEAEVEQLKALRGEGRSFSYCSRKIGRTRNACITKANRLGLSGPKPAQDRVSKPGSIVKPTNPLPHLASRKQVVVPFNKTPNPELRGAEPLHVPATDGRLTGAPTPLMIPLEHLSDHTCKWPIGTPGEGGFGFCGNRSAAGRPYCGFHEAKAYQAPVKHRRPKDYERSLRRYFA